MSYDQWKTASPHDDDLPNQKIAELVKLKGRLCSKNADLDWGGQMVVRDAVLEDPIGASALRLVVEIDLYANICAPVHEDPQRQEDFQTEAYNLVCEEDRYESEWTGSDYWTFWTRKKVQVAVSLDEYEAVETSDSPEFGLIFERLLETIRTEGPVQEFRQAAGRLHSETAKIQQRCDKGD